MRVRRGVRTVLAAWLFGLFVCGVARAEGSVEVEEGKGITFSDEDRETTLNVRFWGQFRFQFSDRDLFRRSDLVQTFPPFDVENVGRNSPSFQVRRFRLAAEGRVHYHWFNYKVELDLAGNDEGLRTVFVPPIFTVGGITDFPGISVHAGDEDKDGRTVKVLDFYADLTPRPYARIRLGAFKVPFGRQELVSDEKLSVAARSIASDFFAPGRDRGAMFHGGTPTQRVQWNLGAFNGTGLVINQNLDEYLAYAARLTGTTKGPYLDIESILDNPPAFGLRAQGGFAWYKSTLTPVRQDPLLALSDIRDDRLEADFGLFWKRVNVFLDYYTRTIEVDQTLDLTTVCYGAFVQGRFSCDQEGYSAQIGWMPTSRQEIVARVSNVNTDKDIDRGEMSEETIAWTYYFRKHNVKMQLSASALKTEMNAAGSSGFAIKIANQPQSTFFDPTAFPGLDDDKNDVFAAQLQWNF